MPEDWEATTLGEHVELIKGLSYKSVHFGGSDAMLVGIKCVTNEGSFNPQGSKAYAGPFKPEHRLTEGDVVLAVTDLTRDIGIIGRPVKISDIPGQEMIASLDLVRVETTTPLVDRRFLYFRLQGADYAAYVKGCATGTTVRHLSPKLISNFAITLPPLPEQLRIADLMSAVDDQLAAYDAQIMAGNRRRSALLTDLLKPQEGWDATIFSEVAHLEYGKALKASERSGSGCPVYGSSGVVGLHEPALVPDPTVIIGRKGNAGAVYLTSGPSSPIDTVYWVRLKNPDVMIDWLGLWCENHDLAGLGQKGARPGLSRDIVHEQEILIPPLSDQQHIADLMGAVDNELDALREAREQTKTLRTALLQDLLSGAHRIPESYDRLLKAKASSNGSEEAVKRESDQAEA